MKKKIIKLTPLLLGLFALTACNQLANVDKPGEVATAKEKNKEELVKNDYESVKKYIQDKGVDNITIDEFDHIDHEDIGSGFICNMYELTDGKLLLSTVNDEQHPFAIVMIDKDGNETPLKTDYSALDRLQDDNQTEDSKEKENTEEDK